MAQTTDAMNMKNAKIELSTNGTSWTDVSGFANSIKPEGGDRSTAEKHTFDGDTPIVLSGKRSMIEVNIVLVYTEGALEGREMLRSAYEGDDLIYVRWSPKGGSATQKQYTASGYVTKNPYPGGESDSADAIVVETTIATAAITEAVISA